MRHRTTLYVVDGRNSVRCVCGWHAGNIDDPKTIDFQIPELLELAQNHVVEFTEEEDSWVCIFADAIQRHSSELLEALGIDAIVQVDHDHTDNSPGSEATVQVRFKIRSEATPIEFEQGASRA